MSDEEENKKKKSKSFKSIEDILNIEGGDNISFDDDSAAELENRYNQTKAAIDEMKKEFEVIKQMDDDDFTKSILKQLVEKSMGMLTALQLEIEDNPTGRGVETAATMVSAINNVVDNFNKVKVYNQKLAIEQEKLELKKSALTQKNLGHDGSPNANILMVGDTNQVLDLLASKGILPSSNPPNSDKTIDVDAIKDDEEK